MQITTRIAAAAGAVLVATSAFAALSSDQVKLLNKSATVLTDLRNAADNGIPAQIWSKAKCIVVIPSLKKAGFIIGGEFGEGVMSCKQGNTWAAPVFMQLTKGSAGLQAGIQSTELVLVVMNQSGVEKLLKNKVTLGADASIAAGPIGRGASAATDAQMTAEMLSYSRAKGLFAGIDLSGGTLKPDNSRNEAAYGANVSAREIAMGTTSVHVPAEARGFTDALGRESAATSGVK
jgi:SH3 domain-containing YSC84-like protein 1